MSDVVEIPVEVWEHCQRDASTIAFLHKECVRLKAEVERLRASSFVTAVPSEHYERVIKAGDAMAKNLSHINWNICVQEWNAAKEGKQS